jgi:hypothetical protein
MNNPLNYRLDQARRADEMQKAEHARLARKANPEAAYNTTLAQLGRALVALGQRLQEKVESQPEPERAYR